MLLDCFDLIFFFFFFCGMAPKPKQVTSYTHYLSTHGCNDSIALLWAIGFFAANFSITYRALYHHGRACWPIANQHQHANADTDTDTVGLVVFSAHRLSAYGGIRSSRLKGGTLQTRC
jgi:hypothetical protein